MDLSIVVVSWNTRDLTAECLKSIYLTSPLTSFEVCVVDNNSQDGSQAMIREGFPQVHLICNERNIGYAGANNVGMRQTAGEYIVLLNSDARVHAGALDCAVSYLREHPDVGIAGVRLLNLDGSIQYYPTAFPDLANQLALLWYLPGRRSFLAGQTNREVPCEVDRVNGACMVLRRQVVQALGGMDESLFLYVEEDDLCYRAGRAGWKVVFLPDVLVTHYGGASTEKLGEQAILHLYKGKLWFVRKYQGKHFAQLLKIVIAISYLVRGVLQRLGISSRRDAHRLKSSSYFRLVQELRLL